MATGGETETGEVNGQTNKILGIKDLNDVISTLERSGFSEDKWNELGLKLHIIETKLNTVKANNPLNVKGCLKDCLVLWLQQSYDTYEYGLPTLPLLAAAVKEMGLRAVATGISPGNTQSQTQSPKEIEHTIEVYSSNYIKDLNGKFALFKAHLLDRLSKHVKDGVINLIEMARFVGELTKVDGLADVVSVDHLFDSFKDHYSYLNYDHIETIVEYYLTDEDQDLKDRMEAYKKDLDNFKKSIKLRQLKKTLDSVRLTHSHSSCKVVIKLVGEWENETLAKLEDFLEQYFEKDSLFSLTHVTDGCLSLTFLVPLSFSQYLIDTATLQLKSMSRVGVLQLVINDVVLLDEKDDTNLNESLIEAVKLGEAFEVSLLLSLGADPYYEDSNGDKVLGVAIHKGNEEIIELISVATDTQVIELESQNELTDQEDRKIGDNDENEKLKVEIQRLLDSNAELERSLAASKSEIDELLLQKKENETELKKQLRKCYLEIENLKVKCKEDLNIISSLEADVRDKEKTVSKQETEIAALQEALSLASLQKEENEAELQKKLTASNMYLENEKLDLDRLLAKSKDDSQVLQDKMLSLEAEVIVKEKMLFEQTEQTKSGTEEIAILQDKISSLSVQLLKQPSRIIGLCEDKSTQSEAIKTMDQSVQSMEILLPEIDRNELKIEGMLTIDDLVDVLDLLKKCGFPETKWHKLGLRLGLRKSTLDVIEMMHRGDVSRCMTECLSQWLRRADNVDSRGGATFDSLSDALRSMNETAVAEKLNQEKSLPALAVSLYNSYSPLLSESLSDPVSVARLLNAEHVITGQVLASVESASPSVPNQREVLLAAIKEAIQRNYSLLQTFASVLCKFSSNVKLGTIIQRDYDKHFSANDKFVDAIIEEDASSIGATIASSPHSLTIPTVQIPVSKNLMEHFTSIRMSFGSMMYHILRSIKQERLPLHDLKDFLYACGSNLEAKIDNCFNISSVLHVIRNECSLTNVSLLKAIVEEFEVTEAERYIEQYKQTLEEFCRSLSISLCLKERLGSIPHLQCETITFVLDWKPEEHELKDIEEILAKITDKFIKIEYIKRSC